MKLVRALGFGVGLCLLAAGMIMSVERGLEDGSAAAMLAGGCLLVAWYVETWRRDDANPKP